MTKTKTWVDRHWRWEMKDATEKLKSGHEYRQPVFTFKWFGLIHRKLEWFIYFFTVLHLGQTSTLLHRLSQTFTSVLTEVDSVLSSVSNIWSTDYKPSLLSLTDSVVAASYESTSVSMSVSSPSERQISSKASTDEQTGSAKREEINDEIVISERLDVFLTVLPGTAFTEWRLGVGIL